MKIAVRYYTKTGNTKRLADAIAAELGVNALPISEPVSEKVDILFLGNSYYAFNIDPEVRDFVALSTEKRSERSSTSVQPPCSIPPIRRLRPWQIRLASRWTKRNSIARASSRASTREDRMQKTSMQLSGL